MTECLFATGPMIQPTNYLQLYLAFCLLIWLSDLSCSLSLFLTLQQSLVF